MKGWRQIPKKVHLKDQNFDFPLYHFDARLKGERLTSNPKEVTCKICLKGMTETEGGNQ